MGREKLSICEVYKIDFASKSVLSQYMNVIVEHANKALKGREKASVFKGYAIDFVSWCALSPYKTNIAERVNEP